jgi:hypothetical protein
MPEKQEAYLMPCDDSIRVYIFMIQNHEKDANAASDSLFIDLIPDFLRAGVCLVQILCPYYTYIPHSENDWQSPRFHSAKRTVFRLPKGPIWGPSLRPWEARPYPCLKA